MFDTVLLERLFIVDGLSWLSSPLIESQLYILLYSSILSLIIPYHEQ